MRAPRKRLLVLPKWLNNGRGSRMHRCILWQPLLFNQLPSRKENIEIFQIEPQSVTIIWVWAQISTPLGEGRRRWRLLGPLSRTVGITNLWKWDLEDFLMIASYPLIELLRVPEIPKYPNSTQKPQVSWLLIDSTIPMYISRLSNARTSPMNQWYKSHWYPCRSS